MTEHFATTRMNMKYGSNMATEDQLKTLNDDNEPLYWIYRHSYREPYGSPDYSLIGSESNNGGRYRWCSYDDAGKEYVEWDSAQDAVMSTPGSSVPSAESPQWQRGAYNQVAKILDTLPMNQVLGILKHEMTYFMEKENLKSDRSLKLLKQLRKFDVEAALELSK